jgi:hypothetical protein
MNDTLQQIIAHGAKVCQEHGYSFISIYQTRREADVIDGWDRFVISYNHLSNEYYRFVGIVRADGTTEIRFP